MEQGEKLCDEVETVREFSYICDRVSAFGGCEVDVTARKNVGRLILGSAVRCCMTEDFFNAERRCL